MQYYASFRCIVILSSRALQRHESTRPDLLPAGSPSLLPPARLPGDYSEIPPGLCFLLTFSLKILKLPFTVKEDIVYAIIQTGGKQYRVGLGDVLRVEKLAGDVGETVTLDNVLLVASGEEVQVGQPLVAGAQVSGQILRQAKAKKILVFKKKRRKNFRRLRGHRQPYTALQIKDIQV
jgi:large subunit ribosomal protein L21